MIKGRDLLHLASKWSLLDQAGEATWRSAVSRAYYGAFHCAQEFLFDELGMELMSGKHNKHFVVQQLLKSTKEPLAQKSARLLQTLLERRNSADYDLRDELVGTQTRSKRAHADAQEIYDLLRQCAGLDNAAKNEMRQNIERLRKIGGF